MSALDTAPTPPTPRSVDLPSDGVDAEGRAPAPGLKGVRIPHQRDETNQRRAALIITILPLVGLAAAVLSLWGRGLSAVDATLAVVFYAITALGITVGYHRHFTHGSFRSRRWVGVALAVAGSAAVQGSLITWVANHRRHHAYSDQVGDPHSPHLVDDLSVTGQLRGLWYAHVGWLFKADGTVRERWAPDLLDDPTWVRIDKAFGPIVAASLILPAVLGGLLTWSLWGAVTAFLWASVVRMFLLHHVTWSINSICHFFGKRPFESHDESTNNAPMAWLSMGEGWHNNHHAFPSSARHGLLPGQFDASWRVIRTMEQLGWVSDVKLPSDAQLARKRREADQTHRGVVARRDR